MKTSTRSKKIEKLDRVFSEFIRKRDTTPYGYCISCNKVITYDTSDCGHYINRKHMSLRFDEKNCNAQCRACNRFDEGCMHGYRRGLIKKIGEEATDMLEIRKHNNSKISEPELDILIAYYKKKIKEL